MSNPIYRELKRALVLSPIAIPIGMVIIFAVLTIFVGDPNEAFGLIFLSIICTAGISLIIWLPVTYAVGYGVITGVRLILKAAGVDIGAIFSRRKTNDSPAPPQNTLQALTSRLDDDPAIKTDLSKDQVALINYIRKAKQKGLSNDAIEHNLDQNGWDTTNIAQAFRLAEQG